MEAKAQQSNGRFSPGRHLFALFLICLFAIIAYLPSFRVPFVYDDLFEIIRNKSLMHLSDWETILKYNPARALLMMTFALDLHFWGANTFPYHLENLLIHIIDAMLVYRIGERLLGGVGRYLRGRAGGRPSESGGDGLSKGDGDGSLKGDGLSKGGDGVSDGTVVPPRGRKGGLETPAGWAPALAVALIFAVHPLFVEAVTYIASRSSSLTALFYLLAFLAYVRFRDAQALERPSHVVWGWLFLGINSYIMAIVTKEEGVSLPAILLAYDFLLAPVREAADSGRRVQPAREATDSDANAVVPESETTTPRVPQRPPVWWLGSVPFWLLFVLLVGARLELFGTLMPPVVVRSMWESGLTGLEVMIAYLGLFFAPVNLTIYHDYLPVTGTIELRTVLAIFFHCVLLVILWKNRNKRPLLSFAIAWYYIALSPTTSIIPLKEAMAEHRMYLASFGMLWCIGQLLSWLRSRWRVPPLAIGAGISIVLAILTYRYNLLWQDDVALWEHATRLAPYSGDAEYALADAYVRRNELDKAMAAYKRSIRNYQKLGMEKSETKYSFVDAINNLGLLYARKGDLDMAMSSFRRALNENPKYTQAWNNLGFAQMRKGNVLEASFAFEGAIQSDEKTWLAHYHLGNLYYGPLYDPEKAVMHYKRVLELNPELPAAERLKKRILELGF